MKQKIVIKLFVIIVGLYLLGGVLLYFFQEKILFRPETLPADYKFSLNYKFNELNLARDGNRNLHVLHFMSDDSVSRGAVVYFHGNGQNSLKYASAMEHFTENGYEVWMMDYPGFGKSTGRISEGVLYDDALVVYNLARKKFEPSQIIIYGRSIGTGIAMNLAAARDCKRLFLETPYVSIEKLARKYFWMYPTFLLSEYHFSSYKVLPRIEAPVTIFHGTNDRLIPYEHATILRDAFQRKADAKNLQNHVELVTIQGAGHDLNPYPDVRRKIDSLLGN